MPGDDPGGIGSGPTVPDATIYAEALGIVEKYAIALPTAIRAHLIQGAVETPKPGDPIFADAETRIVARPQASLESAADVALRAGVTPVILGDALEGEARVVAAEHARQAMSLRVAEGVNQLPMVLLSGGELTVTMKGDGRGGPNAEYMLAMVPALNADPGIHALAVDTDGIDGSEDNAGAIIGPETLSRATQLGVDPSKYLENNDSYHFFKALDDLVMTGPTYTNVNDFRAVLVLS